MKKYYLTALLIFTIIALIIVLPENRDILFQASTINALLEGVYDGDVTYGGLKKHGDTGLGTFDCVDGEMIALDGKFYQIKSDGVAYPVKESTKTPFAAVTFFDPDKTVLINEELNFEKLEQKLDKELPTKNIFYIIKIEGTFKYIKARSIPKQEKPYIPLVEASKNQVIFEFNDISGTIVGLFCPDYMKDLNVPGYHLHFLTKDKKKGGHLLDFIIKNGKVEIDETNEFYMVLPQKDEFYKLDLTKDTQEELNKVEK